MTTGNAADFGDLSVTRGEAGSCSSSTRGIIAGGGTGPASLFNTIDFITIASTGNATDFGDMHDDAYHSASCTNSTRMLNLGGAGKTSYNAIEFITIMTTGNGQDFGDLTYTPRGNSANSNGHGGL